MSLRDNTENTVEETTHDIPGHEIVTVGAQFSVGTLFTFPLEFILSTMAWRWASPSSSSSASPTRAAGHGLELGFFC